MAFFTNPPAGLKEVARFASISHNNTPSGALAAANTFEQWPDDLAPLYNSIPGASIDNNSLITLPQGFYSARIETAGLGGQMVAGLFPTGYASPCVRTFTGKADIANANTATLVGSDYFYVGAGGATFDLMLAVATTNAENTGISSGGVHPFYELFAVVEFQRLRNSAPGANAWAWDDDFSAYADQAAVVTAGYTFGGGNVTFNAASNRVEWAAATGADGLDLTIATVAQTAYVVEFTLTGFSVGEMRAKFNGADSKHVELPAVAGTYRFSFTTGHGATLFSLTPVGASTTANLTDLKIALAHDAPGY